MGLKALMVDVDGVIVVHPDPKGWSANLGRDLGLSARTLQEKFFKPYFADIVHGRAGLHGGWRLFGEEVVRVQVTGPAFTRPLEKGIA